MEVSSSQHPDRQIFSHPARPDLIKSIKILSYDQFGDKFA